MQTNQALDICLSITVFLGQSINKLISYSSSSQNLIYCTIIGSKSGVKISQVPSCVLFPHLSEILQVDELGTTIKRLRILGYQCETRLIIPGLVRRSILGVLYNHNCYSPYSSKSYASINSFMRHSSLPYSAGMWQHYSQTLCKRITLLRRVSQ